MSLDLSRYQGIGQFGRAYRIMLENDSHAPGSVDRVLLEHMIRLCPETAMHLYRHHTPTTVAYRKGSHPELEAYVEQATGGRESDEDRLAGITGFCRSLGERAPQDLDAMQIGGTEEEIIRRGSDWCTDVARVGCALCQVAGLPARLVALFDTSQAYSGHVIVEAYRGGAWGAIDPTTDVVYRHPAGRPATSWELMNAPSLVEAHWRQDGSAFYTRPEQFRAAGITNYLIWQWRDYDYTISSINDYCRSILRMSEQNWPGGLRWLHGEDTINEVGHRPAREA